MSLFRRKSLERSRSNMFAGLSPEQERAARGWLNLFLIRHPNPAQWLYPILVGQARKLALNPPTSAWGRSMRAKKGGYAVQRRYRLEGRHPTARATLCRVVGQNAKWREAAEAKMRASIGLPPPPRVKYLPID